jgi:glycosyltransferase involved in cell wall biosynthesis
MIDKIKQDRFNGLNIVVNINPLKQENISGVGKYLYEILSRLLVLDQSNQYFLFSYGRKNKDIEPRLPQSHNIHYIHYNYPSKLIFILSFFNFPKIDFIKGENGKFIKADIVWLANLDICNLKYKKTKLITTIHDLSFKIYPQFFNLKRRLWHFLVKPRSLLRRSDKIITVSQNTSLDIQNIYEINREKILIMNLGISKKYKVLESDKLENIKSKYGLSKDFILFVGTKEPRKNILSLLKVFQKIKSNDLELVIVGAQGWKEKKWRDFYDGLDKSIKSRIKIIDYCSEEYLPALYNLAKIFVWPSFYEGFGLPILEAMACGCPVITSNNSSLPDIVKDKALLIEAFNTQMLLVAMNSLLKDKELYSFYKEKEFDQNYYSNWDKSAEKILNLFDKI